MPAYEVHWQSSWWLASGEALGDEGSERVDAATEDGATDKLERRRCARLDEDRLPYSWRAWVAGRSKGPTTMRRQSVDGLPGEVELRARFEAEPQVAPLLRWLAAEVPEARPVDLMVALAHGFRLRSSDLAAVAEWAAGQLDDHGLDLALADPIDDHRPEWSLSLRCREAFNRGGSVAAVLRHAHDNGLGMIQLAMAMREAFGLRLSSIKQIVATVCEGDDGEADEMLVSAMGRPG